MNLSQAIFLGITQGISEFLPISSSGHLVIIPWLFNFSDPGLSFDVALHLGTLIAIILFFWKDWIIILNLAFRKIRRQTIPNESFYQKNILWLIILATVPGAIIGYLLEKQAETIFRNPLLIALMLIIGGVFLFWADKKNKPTKDLGNLTKKDALYIGLSQALAIIPGISRSGSTITTGLFLNLSRVSAARFSFLISAPIILGAVVLKLGDFLKNVGKIELAGVIAAAISGYLAIFWLLKFIEKVSYQKFLWYRLALAAIIIIAYIVK